MSAETNVKGAVELPAESSALMHFGFLPKFYAAFVAHHTSNLVKDTGQLELLWAVAGLCAEAGEVSGVCEKALRREGMVSPDHEDKIKDELGDTLWFLVATLNAIGVSLEELMAYNMGKIEHREEAGYYKTQPTKEVADTAG